MKRILLPTVIALTVSGGAIAQQAAEEVETDVEEITESVENTADDMAGEADAAVDEMAAEADETADDMAVDLVPMPGERPTLRNPNAIVREGYLPIEPVDMTAENLTGTRVYGANDEDIGEIDELLLSEDGSSVEKIVVDVGGFLGMGEHEVAVTMEELHIMRSEDGMEFRAYMDATQEELEAQPEYEG